MRPAKWIFGILVVTGIPMALVGGFQTAAKRPAIATVEDFRRAMKELSNWGRWGEKDELGAANLITPAKRKQAAELVREGISVSLAHDVMQERAADAPTILERTLVTVAPNVSLDRYAYSGTYHGVTHSHLDALDCHIMVDGMGYNGVSMDEIKTAGGCPRGSIHALKDGVVTRGVLFDATRLPGKATPQGWLEPGTAVRSEDLETLEKLQRVTVSPGDVILLYTGRWKRRAARGPWPNSEGFAGYHIDVAYFLKERGVSFIAADGPNDVSPSGLPPGVGLHQLALVAMGVGIFDNLDFESAVEQARRLNRYEFLFTAAPLRIEKGTGSPLNPLAVF
jgi:kynurenine formamidase